MRTLLIVLAIVAPQVALAAPQDISVYQLLRSIGDAAESEEASQQLETFLRQVVADELATETPVFCPINGQGAIDGTALREFALARAPTNAAQTATRATDVVTAYLAETYPCR